MKRILSLLLCAVLALTVAFFPGCSGKPNGNIKISVSFYVLYIYVMNLTQGIDGVEISDLTKNFTGCLHEYTLQTADMKALSGADVFIINGLGLESFLDDITAQFENLEIVDSSAGAKTLSEHSGTNAHIWMNIDNAVIQVNNIASALIRILPDDADAIESNRSAYTARLQDLHDQLRPDLSNLREPLIFFHEAYAYFADEFGLNAVSCIDADDELSPSVMSELTNLINSQSVRAIFIEENYKHASAQTLAEETGVGLFILNPLTDGEYTLTAYEDAMQANRNAILEAVG